MSQAEALLSGPDDTDIATDSASGTFSEERIVVDEDRFVYVPDSLRRLGVQHDHNIETVTFECPRYWDGNDLSITDIYINYMCSDRNMGQFLATNLIVEENVIYFDWVISSNVTRSEGAISFLVCAIKTDEDGYEVYHWNSETNKQCYITEGLECSETIVSRNPDVIEYLTRRIDQLEEMIHEILKASES